MISALIHCFYLLLELMLNKKNKKNYTVYIDRQTDAETDRGREVCACVYIQTHTQTAVQIDRCVYIDSSIDRQMCIQTAVQTDRQNNCIKM